MVLGCQSIPRRCYLKVSLWWRPSASISFVMSTPPAVQSGSPPPVSVHGHQHLWTHFSAQESTVAPYQLIDFMQTPSPVIQTTGDRASHPSCSNQAKISLSLSPHLCTPSTTPGSPTFFTSTCHSKTGFKYHYILFKQAKERTFYREDLMLARLWWKQHTQKSCLGKKYYYNFLETQNIPPLWLYNPAHSKEIT